MRWGVVCGTILSGLIIGILTYIALLIFGFPSAIVLAVIAGLLAFIPIAGPFITAVILVPARLSQSLNQAAIALALAIIVRQSG